MTDASITTSDPLAQSKAFVATTEKEHLTCHLFLAKQLPPLF